MGAEKEEEKRDRREEERGYRIDTHAANWCHLVVDTKRSRPAGRKNCCF